jgi:hypothetical protein
MQHPSSTANNKERELTLIEDPVKVDNASINSHKRYYIDIIDTHQPDPPLPGRIGIHLIFNKPSRISSL